MARRLTKKQQGFVNDYVATGSGTKAALDNYDIGSRGSLKPLNVAAALATRELNKVKIQEAIEVKKKALQT